MGVLYVPIHVYTCGSMANSLGLELPQSDVIIYLTSRPCSVTICLKPNPDIVYIGGIIFLSFGRKSGDPSSTRADVTKQSIGSLETNYRCIRYKALCAVDGSASSSQQIANMAYGCHSRRLVWFSLLDVIYIVIKVKTGVPHKYEWDVADREKNAPFCVFSL